MRYPKLAVALAVMLLAVGAFPQDKGPDFSGFWHWNPQKSQLPARPAEDWRVKIEQKGAELTITSRVRAAGSTEEATTHYRIRSDDDRNLMHGAPMTSRSRWQAGALAIDSVANFDGDLLRLNDLWTLSPDGQTLTFKERHQFRADPAEEEVIVFEKQASETWAPPEAPKVAEEVYKNIQVLKGVPADRVIPAMMFFTKSLGVRCDHCHVPDQFERDDKPAKQTARRMLRMVHEINDSSFPDNKIVSCWMCHRGSVKPQSVPQ